MSPRLLPPSGARRVLDLLADADTVLWEADPETGRFTSVSETAEGVVGFAPQEWIEDPDLWLGRIHPDDRDAVSAAWDRARRGERLDVEYRFATKADRETWLWQDGPQKTLAISEQTTMILGYAPEEWYEDPGLWRKIVHPDDVERLDAAERAGGFAGGIEYRMIAKDGRIVWVHDRSRLITDGDGVPRYWLR